MNVFVLNTGRCGSKTFARVCHAHIKNFTTGFETRSQFIGVERLNYPVNHIEVDNRLSWFLGRLDAQYGNDAAYVHLWRNPIKVAKSYLRRYRQGIMKAYRGKGIVLDIDKSTPPMDIALDYCHTVNSNIELFLKDKTHKIAFDINSAELHFPIFCNIINANVDMENALKHFEKRYNASKRKK
jgi:hypothetical protein